MKQARLIKKTELIERATQALSARQTAKARRLGVGDTQAMLTNWVGEFRASRAPNPRTAFAALFATEN